MTTTATEDAGRFLKFRAEARAQQIEEARIAAAIAEHARDRANQALARAQQDARIATETYGIAVRRLYKLVDAEEMAK